MLDMGRPVRILELAQKMVALSGLKGKVKIEITGLRPGEKLREDLVSTTEVSVASAVPKVRVVESLPDEGEFVDRMLRRLLRAEESGDPGRVRDELALFAPGLTGRARGQEAVLPTLTIDDIVETKSPAA
jgi:O-antigen biosynthesis protein WbqV